MKSSYIKSLPLFLLLLVSCSTTKTVPEDDQLFVGLTKIDYQNYERNAHFISVQEEVEAALATTPNGALFGSSYYRTPFPFRLWVWNAFSEKESKFAKWMTKTFGKQPVLMSTVNPALRASVAQSVLKKNGYFHGKVTYDVVPSRNPKKSKIGYTVQMNHLFTIDTVSYEGFTFEADSLVQATQSEAIIGKGDPFSVSTLDAERKRVSSLLRNNGFFFYQPGYASWLADTLAESGRVQMRLQAADNLPSEATKKWYIGNITVDIRKQFMQEMTDSVGRRYFKVRFNGKKPAVRMSVIMNSLKLRHGQPYSYDSYLESVSKLNGTGVFSMTDMSFTPRTTPNDTLFSAPISSLPDTLDLLLNCVLEKPYNTYIETNIKNKTSGRVGPELRLGLTKRNAFRGGELLDINLHGSYEWQHGQGTKGSSRLNSYEYGIDASLEFPRIMLPWREAFLRRSANRAQQARSDTTNLRSRLRRMRQRYYGTPSTLAKLSRNTLNRPSFFKMVNFSGEWTYRWQRTQTSRHEFSPLTITYQHIAEYTDEFISILEDNLYLLGTMDDMFIPKMRYTYAYSSPASMLNPISWEITLSESGNLASLAYLAAGKRWNSKEKEMFKNPYSQFLKLETDFTKRWRVSSSSQLVGHLNAGVIYSYGNSVDAPFSEMFYVGGANSIRAYTARSIGPGAFPKYDNATFSYLLQNGDIKLQANLEYRTRLFGNLHGALFLDAGNVWVIDNNLLSEDEQSQIFKFNSFFRQMAVGTGVGLRYDLEFLVLRLDWGVGLHLPYSTGKSGFFNISKFSDNHAIHLAVGYPF